MDNLWYPESSLPGWEIKYSYPGGYPYRVWRRKMSRLLQEYILNCVVYLYPSVPEAMQGTRTGGSGFLVSVFIPSLKENRCYAVTNAHVIEGGATVIRLNTIEGEKQTIEPDKDNHWIQHPQQDDVAILPVELSPMFASWSVSTGLFLTKDKAEYFNIGVGDDILMVGRYIDHEGTQKNTPAVRFGNISIMPSEKVYQSPRKHFQESYVVETRSLPGFSGSPVFVQIPTYTPRPKKDSGSYDMPTKPIGAYLLGVDWGHFGFRIKVPGEDKPIDVYSAMTGVVPAWQIIELIDLELREYMMKRKGDEGRAILDSLIEKKPFTRDDFMRDLDKVVRKKGGKKPPKSGARNSQT